jgi:hypothetical protein
MPKVLWRARNRARGGSPWSLPALLLALTAPALSQSILHGLVEAIHDEQRLPVAEAAVRAFVDDEAVAVAFTDREGRYTLEVPAASFELRLVKPGYAVARAAGLDRPRVQRTCRAPGDCGQIDFLVERAAAVEVWLADPSGDPFPRAFAQLTALGREDTGATRVLETDDRGVARFHGLEPGRYRLELQPRDSPIGVGQIYEMGPAELELRPGENTPIHLSARRAGAETFSLSGVIEGVDFDKNAYTLEIRPIRGGSIGGRTLVQHRPEVLLPRLGRGEYVLQLIPHGVRERVRPLSLGRIRLEENRSGLVLQSKPQPRLIGHVSFEDGAPDAVRLELRSDEGWTWDSVHVERRSPSFTITTAPPGRYTLRSAGNDYFLVEAPDFHLVEGADRSVRATVSARFARISGVVRGAGEGSVRVELSGPLGESVAATAGDGSFAFDRLPPGDYALCAALPERACASESRRQFQVEAGDEVEIELGPPR